MKRILLVAATLSLTASLAVAGPTGKDKKPVKPAPKKVAVVCPVMKGEIKDVKKAEKSTYKGKTYYFCCEGCKPEFDKNPAKFVKAPVARPAKPAVKPGKKA